MLLLLDLKRVDESVVIYFDSTQSRINAYTLASTLVAFADAAKLANADLNHGYDIEIVVEALGGGSFRTKLVAVYTKANNLFSQHVLLSIVLGVVVSHFVEKALWPDKSPQIRIETDEVVFEDGSTQVVIPRQVYDAGKKIGEQARFKQAIAKIAEKVVADDSPRPALIVDRAQLIVLASGSAEDEEDRRVVEEQCELQIVGAILVPGRRKWEFIWRGVKITAPILDQSVLRPLYQSRDHDCARRYTQSALGDDPAERSKDRRLHDVRL
jgi:hypothetical protein